MSTCTKSTLINRCGASSLTTVARSAIASNVLVTCMVSSILLIGWAPHDLGAAEIYYHSNTYDSSTTTFPSTGFPVAVKFDLPIPSQTYQIGSLGILSQGDLNPFPANTQIAVRVWDSSGAPVYTSSAFDFSGKDASLNMRWLDISAAHIQVTNSFYMGYQDLTGTTHFGYKVDSSAGNNYGHSYRYDVGAGIWTAGSEDLWFNANVQLVGLTWVGAGSDWNYGSNWRTSTADYALGYSHTFDDTATGTTVDLSGGGFTPSSVLFHNSSKNYTITGASGIAGTATVTKQGTGTVTMSSVNTYSGLTTVEAGRLVLKGNTKAMVPVLNYGGTNIKGGMLVLDYTGESDPVNTVKSLLTASYNGGAFDTGKFQSSTASSRYGLGWTDNTGTSKITIAYTTYGDLNLDGTTNFTDLSKFLSKYNSPGVWADGDTNYDGMVNFVDLSKLLSVYGPPPLPPLIQSPEPSSVIMLTIASLIGAWTIRRRRR